MTLGIEGLGTQCQQTREWSPLRAADVTVYSGRFEGRTAIVTGTASGIGRDVARRLAAEGARVSMWDLNASALATAAMEVGAAHTQGSRHRRRRCRRRGHAAEHR
jgi:phosphoglycerate dehydrogenase-like enzyme